jgi:hypothetical protein
MNPAYLHSLGLGTKHATIPLFSSGKARQIASSGNFLNGQKLAIIYLGVALSLISYFETVRKVKLWRSANFSVLETGRESCDSLMMSVIEATAEVYFTAFKSLKPRPLFCPMIQSFGNQM